jgi:hypothetical protein
VDLLKSNFTEAPACKGVEFNRFGSFKETLKHAISEPVMTQEWVNASRFDNFWGKLAAPFSLVVHPLHIMWAFFCR